MSSSPISLVVTDLDGTLWDGTETIHDSSLAAMRTVADRGFPLLVATGRRRNSAKAGLARAGLTPPAVVLGGALGVDLATGEVFHRAGFRSAVAVEVLARFLAHGIEPCVYVDRPDADVVLGSDPGTHPEHVRALGPNAVRDDLARVVAEETVLAIGVAGLDEADLRVVADDLGAVAAGGVFRDTFFGRSTFIAVPPGVSKWEGVVAFCARHDLDPTRVLAVGDAENDLELLAGAAIAVVVDDGHESALALAHHTIPAASQGGWAAILDLL